ncbi:hypothetical protein LOD99_1559 [Oopsacas minuta]|uniref:Uncharacterized protein n=1 Tax=Oopsacas minuta TaxID=111878 RepID=A0AAV7K4V3_9METZ|nr:hypothetical protein LOD99_1559 [Oopsacas minuta]
MHSDGRRVIKSIPLSNDSVARRINMMTSDVEKTLYSKLKTTEFSLQIDESTLPGNEALLLAYVQYILEGIMVEEMLFARPLVTDTKAGLQISDDDLLAYCEHLGVLKADMIKRFTDLLEIKLPHWLIDPFCVDAKQFLLYLQEVLMDLQSDCEEKVDFTMMGYE